MAIKIDPNELYFGWKDIAGILQISEKTARRYEQVEGLRVKRLSTERRGKADRGRIYATGQMLKDFIERG